ncbi:DUF5688 family protein [Blautia coccoides]|uniref:DUF5688 family protein n=1 Tax=Blautia producta TaxID=33035 RepID=UPI0028A3A626|nr:DUF5688 family protein [Blautia coccoides]MDT4376973.1 DUF5688 family protein [Blautia coccoides]
MDYREFINEIRENILDFMPPEYAAAEVRVDGVMKNNSVMKQGLSIHKDGAVITPKLYLEDFFQSYENGTSMENVCSRIANEYVKHTIDDKTFSAEAIMDFEKAKSNITTKVVCAKNNKSLLRDRPSTKLDDLAVVYQVEIGITQIGKCTTPITNEIMKSWGVTVNDIHKIAVENTERLNPSRLIPLESVIFGTEENFLEEGKPYEQCAMMVLTNENKVGGAAVLANSDTLGKVSEVINDSFYILPSSVHDVIVIPKEMAREMGMTSKELGEMVRNVNAHEVSREEQLSDHIYEFDKDKKLLETVKDSKEKTKDLER